jgi:murein DD-endopeptidase MepM/ murein hydrolase activator NlpD
MQSLKSERRRALAPRRQRVRRRRLGALVVSFLALVVLAVWTAVWLTTPTPAHVPDLGVATAFGAQAAANHVAVAQLEGADVLLPVRGDLTTAIAFHPVDNANAVAFSPQGSLVSGGGIATKVADAFKSGGGVQYYLMGGNGSDNSAATAGLDVGAVPGSTIFSPVDGRVTNVKRYKLLGRYVDYEVDITMANDPSLMIVLTHVASPTVALGDPVRAGETKIGDVRAFPGAVAQSLKQYTTDAGDHVQLVALRASAPMTGY